MLSDEEKKAIERFKANANYCITSKETTQTILNLIEKQQKEIEGLKKPKYLFNAKTGEITTINNSEFISKDKIKAKIEELEKQQKEEPDAYLCIKVLRSLLEKE